MTKKILITGATSGIGLETVKTLAKQGHHLLVHGRTAAKLEALTRSLTEVPGAGPVEGYIADLSRMVDVEALAAAVKGKHVALDGRVRLGDFEAYAQSKLALTMWSCHLGRTLGDQGPVFVAVNPGSMLGTNMVKDGFGVAGKDVRIGSNILARAALSDEFAAAQGAYFDNDAGRFAKPHPDALDPAERRRTHHRCQGA